MTRSVLNIEEFIKRNPALSEDALATKISNKELNEVRLNLDLSVE